MLKGLGLDIFSMDELVSPGLKFERPHLLQIQEALQFA